MPPVIHHLQVTVPDVKQAEPFYDQLFTILGYDIQQKYNGYLEHSDMQIVEYIGSNFDFGICSPKAEFKGQKVDSRRPGALQHVAFACESNKEVDELFERLKDIEGISILHGEPREYREKIAPGYYALFFETIDGIRFELFHHA